MFDDSEVAVKGFLGSTYYMKMITHYDFFRTLSKHSAPEENPWYHSNSNEPPPISLTKQRSRSVGTRSSYQSYAWSLRLSIAPLLLSQCRGSGLLFPLRRVPTISLSSQRGAGRKVKIDKCFAEIVWDWWEILGRFVRNVLQIDEKLFADWWEIFCRLMRNV